MNWIPESESDPRLPLDDADARPVVHLEFDRRLGPSLAVLRGVDGRLVVDPLVRDPLRQRRRRSADVPPVVGLETPRVRPTRRSPREVAVPTAIERERLARPIDLQSVTREVRCEVVADHHPDTRPIVDHR